ncbi:hypothetical protein CN145_33515 [Sinorhizobium meliloti]|nr:hypothetical protein CN145_33515 [Sinorhizobium meliloti]RVP51432.1 hypothetical protein CN076_32110 [Sinorhizobium meliloti]RVP83477.1 hypothetical protein CN073_31505 [Sinorhizobium meliloti]
MSACRDIGGWELPLTGWIAGRGDGYAASFLPVDERARREDERAPLIPSPRLQGKGAGRRMRGSSSFVRRPRHG